MDGIGLLRTGQRQRVSFIIMFGQVMPVEMDCEAFDTVAQADAFAARQESKAVEPVCQVVC